MIGKILRILYGKYLDCRDWLARLATGRLHFPPRRLRDVGGDSLEDFEQTGQEFLGYFSKLCDLSPTAHILEIGCGSGRIALPLTGYLVDGGTYTGVEIVKPSVDWCVRRISSRFPNFSFVHADLYNKRYNPDATVSAGTYRFPFDDASFDFIYLTSVFTHLLPDDMEHYLGEIRRLLRRDGQAFITCFLLNETQHKLAEEGKNEIDFFPVDDRYSVRDREVPESAVAYVEHYLIDTLRNLGFQLVRPILYGTWSGRRNGLSFQDVLVFSSDQG